MATSSTSFLLLSRRFGRFNRLRTTEMARNQTNLPTTELLRASYSSLCCQQNNQNNATKNIKVKTSILFDNLMFVRSKKTRSKGSKKEQEDGDEEEEEEEEDDTAEENPLLVDDLRESDVDGVEHVDISISSLRLDAVAKVAFGITRAKVEELFYKGDLFVNGEKPAKKSQDIVEGDEIDMKHHINQENHNLVDIKRFQVLKMPDKMTSGGRFKIKICRWQKLTVKAYDNK